MSRAGVGNGWTTTSRCARPAASTPAVYSASSRFPGADRPCDEEQVYREQREGHGPDEESPSAQGRLTQTGQREQGRQWGQPRLEEAALPLAQVVGHQ